MKPRYCKNCHGPIFEVAGIPLCVGKSVLVGLFILVMVVMFALGVMLK